MKAVHKEDSKEVRITQDDISFRLFCNARNPLAASVIADVINNALKTDENKGGFWHTTILRSIIESETE
jgi:hypothetical protein